MAHTKQILLTRVAKVPYFNVELIDIKLRWTQIDSVFGMLGDLSDRFEYTLWVM